MYAIKPAILLLSLCLGSLLTYGQAAPKPVIAKDSLPVKFDSLKAVIVTARDIRPRINGDTVEFNTAHIKMRPNAAVEEMLARLPGLQIDANGNITYNGQKISHLLVDGEDFFGNDPAIVTRNFDASRIDKVQILDRKSDQAIFTGIDDGTRTKTLNLVMKQESKNGYFGKIEGGADPQGIYNVNGLLTDFQGREQIAALGVASNTGSTGFSSSAGGSSDGLNAQTDNSDALGASAGTGIPHYVGGAFHYANTWNGPDDHFVSNPQYGYYFTQPVTTTQSLQTLPDSVYGQYQQSHSTNRQNQYFANAIYDGIPDSLSAYRVGCHLSEVMSVNQYGDTALSTFNGVNVNSSLRTITDNVSQHNVGASASYRIRARHNAAKVFSIYVDWSSANATTNGYLYSVDRFYQPNGSLQSQDTTDQRKHIVTQSLGLNGNLTYTEPLWPKAVLGLTYGLSYAGSNALQGTYNKDNGKYDQYVDSLSSHFKDHNLNQQGSVNIQGGDNKLHYTLGTEVQLYSYRQQDLQADSVSFYQYFNFTPHLRISYTPDHNTHIGLEYTGNSQTPSITQLQPAVNNSNPLAITLGNPSLRPGFNQNWQLNFSQVKTWMYSINLNFGLASNSISTRTTIDSLGRQVSQPFNVEGGKNAGVGLNVHRRILGIELGLSAGTNYSRSFNYVNADLNHTDSYTASGGLSLGYYSADKYSFQLNTFVNYFDTRSSVNTAAPVHYWTQSHRGTFSLFFIPGFEINTDVSYTWQQSTSAFASSTSVLLWNSSVLHNFLNNRLAVKFQANNMLNANAGISRTSSANLNTESSTNILGRYWLLSVAYRFDHPWRKK